MEDKLSQFNVDLELKWYTWYITEAANDLLNKPSNI